MNRSVRYQVMPPLSPDEYQELHDDIKANGVLVPVVEDENGVLIDGHHRQKIAFELGVPCPVEIIEGKSEAEKRGMAFTLNLKRRHLNREQRRALIAESLKQDPQLSNREHARRTGAHQTTVGTVREELVERGQVSKLDTSTGADGKSYPASQPPRVTSDVSETPNNPEPGPVSDFINREQLDALNKPPLPEPAAPRAEGITKQFSSAIVDLTRVTKRFDRIAQDPNFSRNREKVAALHRHDLNRLIGELQTIANEIN